VTGAALTLQQVGRGSWRHWNEFIKPAVAEGKKFQDILIPTMDTVRYSYMMDFFIQHERCAGLVIVLKDNFRPKSIARSLVALTAFRVIES